MQLLSEDDPLLRQPSEAYSREEIKLPATQQFITELYNFMIKNNGIGIAAVQVGVLKKVICINLPEIKEIMFNPKILKRQGSKEMNEGCLSYPNVVKRIKRSDTIFVSWTNVSGKTMARSFSGLAARVILHEHDHTVGKVFIDL